MPRFNFTFQEASPLIVYTGLWIESGLQMDLKTKFYDGSFRATNSSGAKATLQFVGTGVSLFGAKRLNHGSYSVDLDNGTLTSGNGFAGTPIFKTSLWDAPNLTHEQHTVELTNGPTSAAPFLDLDFVTIEREIGNDSDAMFLYTLDDTSPFVHYDESWQPSTIMKSQNSNGTTHQTSAAGSQLSIVFGGSSIELYGLYANAAYTVTLDNHPPVAMQGLDVDLPPDVWHPQTLLYLMDGLSEESKHNVTITATSANPQRPFSFDYAVVRSTQNFSADGSPFPAEVSLTGSSAASLSPPPLGLIMGLSVLGVALLALGFMAYLFLRRRRRRRPSSRMDIMKEAVDLPQGSCESAASMQVPDYDNTSADTLAAVVIPWRQSQHEDEKDPNIYANRSGTRTPQATGVSTFRTESQEEDAGIVLDGTSESLPPAYSPSWNQCY